MLVRWGGEEFLVVSRYTNRVNAVDHAERIRKKIADHPFDLGGGTIINLTCSIGFACYPFLPYQPEALSWEQIISIADKALYAAKKTQRDAWVGLAATQTTSSQDLSSHLLTDLNEMIEADDLQAVTSLVDNQTLVWH